VRTTVTTLRDNRARECGIGHTNERDARNEWVRRDTESTMMGVEMMGDHMRGGGRFGDADDDLSCDMIPSAEVGLPACLSADCPCSK
jgi:hypothetical protein